MVTIGQLDRVYSTETCINDMTSALNKIVNPLGIVKVISNFCSWHSMFSPAVAVFLAKLGRSQNLFRDTTETINALSDRSAYVASFIFDATRGFNSEEFVPRNSSTCLSQAMLKGMIEYKHHKYHELNIKQNINKLLEEPPVLEQLKKEMLRGYGLGTPDTLKYIFKAWGFHLGAKRLTAQDFTILDQYLRNEEKDLVDYLQRFPFSAPDASFPGYAWMNIHSNDGKAVEMQHFSTALKGINNALSYVDPALHYDLYTHITDGYSNFALHRQTLLTKL